MTQPTLADAVASLGLAETSYFVEQGHHWPFLADLLEAVPRAELAALPSLAFVLLKPDAVLSGKVRPALELLGEAGLAVVDAAVCLTTHPRQFEELYKLNLTLYNQQNMVGAWWLNRQVYELAPVVTLLLTLPGGGPGATHHRLSAIKGPSSPYRCQPDQLRARLAATNRSINLLHTADGPISTARELLLFHPLERLRQALRRVQGGQVEAALAPESLEAELAALPGCVLETDFLRVLETVKARMVKLLRERGELGDTPRLAATRYEMAAVAAGGGPLLERTRRYRELSRCESGHLRGESRTEPTELFRALQQLADFDRMGVEAAQDACAALQGAYAWISAWERLILETSLYYLNDFLDFEPGAGGDSAGPRTGRAPALRR